MTTNFIKTNFRVQPFYVVESMKHQFDISDENFEILVDHLCNELAENIEGFEIQDDVVFVKVGGKMMSITPKVKN